MLLALPAVRTLKNIARIDEDSDDQSESPVSFACALVPEFVVVLVREQAAVHARVQCVPSVPSRDEWLVSFRFRPLQQPEQPSVIVAVLEWERKIVIARLLTQIRLDAPGQKRSLTGDRENHQKVLSVVHLVGPAELGG